MAYRPQRIATRAALAAAHKVFDPGAYPGANHAAAAVSLTRLRKLLRETLAG